MSIWELYLQYLTEVVEGKRTAPEGISLTATEEMARAVELQTQIESMGLENFVKACAAQDGTELDQAQFDAFCLDDVQQLLSQLPLSQEEPPLEEAPEQTPPSEPRNAYEVLLDCCFLEESMMGYLFELIRTGNEKGFWQLAQVATRTDMPMEGFLLWLRTLEDRASEEERACAILMDACFDRLRADGQMELLAALLAGDEKTFATFRCEAPELQQVPAATMAWFETNYLDRYYPVRVIMKASGIEL